MAAVREAIQPAGTWSSTSLASSLAHASWNLRHARRAENQNYNGLACPNLDPALVQETDARLRSIPIHAQRIVRRMCVDVQLNRPNCPNPVRRRPRKPWRCPDATWILDGLPVERP
jgi:hypothetical protein